MIVNIMTLMAVYAILRAFLWFIENYLDNFPRSMLHFPNKGQNGRLNTWDSHSPKNELEKNNVRK